jgi:hypothetical protein
MVGFLAVAGFGGLTAAFVSVWTGGISDFFGEAIEVNIFNFAPKILFRFSETVYFDLARCLFDFWTGERS